MVSMQVWYDADRKDSRVRERSCGGLDHRVLLLTHRQGGVESLQQEAGS